jgi:hypothetical protein
MGEVVDAPVRLRDPDHAEELDRTLARLGLAHLGLVGADHFHDLPADLVQGVQTGQRVLEDHADLGATDPAQLIRAHREQILPFEKGTTADTRTGVEAEQRLRRDTLARAGLAHDAECPTGLDAEADTTNRLNHAVRGIE